MDSSPQNRVLIMFKKVPGIYVLTDIPLKCAIHVPRISRLIIDKSNDDRYSNEYMLITYISYWQIVNIEEPI